jgi:hypothetical protein
MSEQIKGSWEPVQEAIKDYLSDYELYDGEICHVPNEIESLLIHDAIAGLLEDENFQKEFVKWLGQAALSTRKVYGFGVISKTEPQRLVYETQRSAEMESSYLNKHCKEGSPFRPVELFYEDQS